MIINSLAALSPLTSGVGCSQSAALLIAFPLFLKVNGLGFKCNLGLIPRALQLSSWCSVPQFITFGGREIFEGVLAPDVGQGSRFPTLTTS